MKFLNFFEKNENFFFAWHSTKICSRYKDDLKNEFGHNYLTNIDDMYTEIGSFSKGKLHKKFEISEFFEKN